MICSKKRSMKKWDEIKDLICSNTYFHDLLFRNYRLSGKIASILKFKDIFIKNDSLKNHFNLQLIPLDVGDEAFFIFNKFIPNHSFLNAKKEIRLELNSEFQRLTNLHHIICGSGMDTIKVQFEMNQYYLKWIIRELFHANCEWNNIPLCLTNIIFKYLKNAIDSTNILCPQIRPNLPWATTQIIDVTKYQTFAAKFIKSLIKNGGIKSTDYYIKNGMIVFITGSMELFRFTLCSKSDRINTNSIPFNQFTCFNFFNTLRMEQFETYETSKNGLHKFIIIVYAIPAMKLSYIPNIHQFRNTITKSEITSHLNNNKSSLLNEKDTGKLFFIDLISTIILEQAAETNKNMDIGMLLFENQKSSTFVHLRKYKNSEHNKLISDIDNTKHTLKAKMLVSTKKVKSLITNTDNIYYKMDDHKNLINQQLNKQKNIENNIKELRNLENIINKSSHPIHIFHRHLGFSLNCNTGHGGLSVIRIGFNKKHIARSLSNEFCMEGYKIKDIAIVNLNNISLSMMDNTKPIKYDLEKQLSIYKSFKEDEKEKIIKNDKDTTSHPFNHEYNHLLQIAIGNESKFKLSPKIDISDIKISTDHIWVEIDTGIFALFYMNKHLVKITPITSIEIGPIRDLLHIALNGTLITTQPAVHDESIDAKSNDDESNNTFDDIPITFQQKLNSLTKTKNNNNKIKEWSISYFSWTQSRVISDNIRGKIAFFWWFIIKDQK